MKSLGKLVPVLAITTILSACGGSATTTSDVSGSLPDTTADLNSAPVISGTPATRVDEGASYRFTPVSSDAEGDTLSFSVSNLPAWASFNTANGSLSGTPDYTMAGTYANITIRVSDGQQSAALPAFTIQVNDVQQGSTSPDVTGPPVAISATVSGSNIVLNWEQNNVFPDGGFDLWIDTVDTGTKYRTTALSATLSGMDLTVRHCFQVESRYPSVSEFYLSNQVCSTAQDAPNQAPVISGAPSSSATVGTSYGFTPSASDPDGDSLSFTASNLPSWLSLNSATGAISGTPAAGDEGDYNNILIMASDGTDTASLAAFSITVNAAPEPVAKGSMDLNWSAPSTRSDGSVLNASEIAGYEVYVGTSSNDLQMVADVNDGSLTNYTVDDLDVGTYYVAVTTYDMDGMTSSLSNVVAKTVAAN